MWRAGGASYGTARRRAMCHLASAPERKCGSTLYSRPRLQPCGRRRCGRPKTEGILLGVLKITVHEALFEGGAELGRRAQASTASATGRCAGLIYPKSQSSPVSSSGGGRLRWRAPSKRKTERWPSPASFPPPASSWTTRRFVQCD
eukprot:364937-Chlamydomonas_euryale.AAC.10